MNYELIPQQLWDNGIVIYNTGKQYADVSVINRVLEQFTKTMIVGKHHVDNDKRLQIVSEKEMFGSDYLHWHHDQSYAPGNYEGTLLAFQAADYETYTEFANMRLAYDNLTKLQQEQYSHITCSYGAPDNYINIIHPAQQRIMKSAPKSKPLVITHPITNKKSLYFSPLTFVGSNLPLDTAGLLEHCEKFAFKHYWSPGDIVLWDNRTMIHRRMAFKGHRELLRVSFRYDNND